MGEVVIAVAKEVVINILVKEVVKRVLKKQHGRSEKGAVKGSNSQSFRLGKGDDAKIIIFRMCCS